MAFLFLWLGIFSKARKKVTPKVVVHSAYFAEQKRAEFSISQSKDKNVVFIWLEEPKQGG